MPQHELGAPPVGTHIAGRYVLTRFLGAGGMGAVYEACATDGRRFALKMLLDKVRQSKSADLFIERFRRESAVTGTLDTPHVLRTVDAGVDEALGVPFMVMPLLVGLDLWELVGRVGPLHPTVAVRIARQACMGIAVAHAAGVVHRDIKPANIFLDHEPGGRVTTRVIDFGVAKIRNDGGAQLTTTGSVFGSPLYMPPEQFTDGKRVDARGDLWSLGVSLYEALTGRTPFADARNITELYVAIGTKDAPLIQEFAPWIDPGLALVVHGTLIRDREQRCPSARELAIALEPYAYGSDDLTAAMFERLSPDVQGYRAERATPPTSWLVVRPRQAAHHITLADADPLAGHVLAGRYRLLRRLGEGGMGVVYEAELADKSRVAVKVIRPELAGGSSTARKRFVRESKAALGIESPHVVRVIEIDTDADRELPFIALELMRGTDLEAVVRQKGPLSPPVAARLFRQACRGLAAVHARGLVHRDVKPANLFLDRQPSGEVIVKLCDFGIAKQVATEGGDDERNATAKLTRTAGVLGSPMYMSPEQAMNAKTLDQRSDVWSLGATLYEALSGVPPWHGKDSLGEIMVAICTQRLTSVQDRAPWVPAALADIVHRAMRREPAERYPTVIDFERALEAASGGEARVTEEDLITVSETSRTVLAPRGALSVDPTPPLSGDGPTIENLSGRAAVSSAVTGAADAMGGSPATLSGAGRTLSADGRSRSRGPIIAVGVVAVASVIGALGWQFTRDVGRTPEAVGDGPTGAEVSAEPASSVASPPAGVTTATNKTEVQIVIVPATALVDVDGVARALEGGKLVLAGHPGDKFEVVVSEGSRRVGRTVGIAEDGKATVDRIELPEAGPAAKVLVGAKPPPTGAAPLPTVTAPQPAGATPAAIKGPKPKDDWK